MARQRTKERNTLLDCRTNQSFRFFWATCIGVLISVFLIIALLGTGSAVASSGDDGVDIGHSEGALANQSATHMWSHDIEAAGDLHEIRLDYSGTGTDVSGLTTDDVHLIIDDDSNHQFEISNVGDEVLMLTLDESVTASDEIEVHANDEVINPEAGTHSASIELYTESGTFSEATISFEILAVGTLKGQVTNSSTGEPIAGATVEADNSSKYINIETVTNETGWYSMEVGALTYDQITADADWYAYNRTRNVIVDAGEVNTTNASLDPAGAFTGTVTDTDGNVIERADVNFENNTYPEIYDDRTAADGTFRVDVDPNNEYKLTAEANFHEDNESTSYTVAQGEEIDVGTIELTLSDDPETITGTVTNASGDPIQGATITAKNQSVKQNYEATVHYETETDATGEYAIDVPEGNTSVSVSTQWYGENETIANAPAEDVTLILEQTGTLTGTIEDSNGDGLADAMVSIYPPEGGQGLDLDHTDSDGSYSLSAPPGTYDLGIFHEDYPDEFHRSVEIIGAAETVEDYTLQDPGEITGVVRDDNGDPLQGIDVSAHDTSFINFADSVTDANGEFTLTVAPGTYEVSVRSDDYPVERSTGITVSEGGSADVEFDLIEPSYISGEVRNESGSLVENVSVIAQSDGNSYFEHSQDGEYNLSVPSGAHRVMVFAEEGYLPGEDIETQPGEVYQKDFTLLNVTVVDKSVEVISGSGIDEANLSVEAELQGPLAIWLNNEQYTPPYPGMPNGLEELGVTDDTEFEINVTVTNFETDSLLWAGEDVSWESQENETVDNATDITIRTKAVNLEAVEFDGDGNPVHIGPLFGQDPSDIRWPADQDDTATIGWNQTVYLGLFDQSNVPESIQDSLQGMTVVTNAQTFSMPTVTDDSLEVWVGGPSRTTEGEPHDGLYQAFIPDDLLDSWGVDDPEADLEALYRGDSTDFTVTETTDGAWIEIDDISYSAGFIEVEAGSEETDPSPTPSSTPSSSSSPSVDPGPEPEIIEDPSELAAVDVPAGVEAQRVERIDISVNEETGASQATFSETSAVERITFSDVAEGSSEVTELDGEPTETGSAPGGSVSTIQISVPEKATNSAATIRSRVSQDRLDDVGADAADLRINRFNADAGEWQRLETDLIEATDERVVLEAETPGFSIFTVSAVGQPTAVIDAPTDVEEDVEITLDGGDSSSPYSDIKAYEWTIEGESVTGESVTTAFDTPGEYTVSLTVVNEGDETDTTETTITVSEAASVADSDSVSESEPEPESQSEPEEVPGFGVVVALLSLIIVSLLAARYRT